MEGDYKAFVVENWDTGACRYLALSHLLEVHYVEDADDAVHFARREDAERACFGGELCDLRINEHLWPGGEPRKPVIPEDKWRIVPVEWTCQQDHCLGDGMRSICTYKSDSGDWAYAPIADPDKIDHTDYETFITGFADEQAAINHAVDRAIERLRYED